MLRVAVFSRHFPYSRRLQLKLRLVLDGKKFMDLFFRSGASPDQANER